MLEDIELMIEEKIGQDDTTIWVAEADESILGLLVSRYMEIPSMFELHKKGYIAETVVLPEFQNQGIGAQLLQRAEAWLIDLGVDHIGLQVSVSNEKADEFWRRHGYTPATIHMVKAIKK